MRFKIYITIIPPLIPGVYLPRQKLNMNSYLLNSFSSEITQQFPKFITSFFHSINEIQTNYYTKVKTETLKLFIYLH